MLTPLMDMSFGEGTTSESDDDMINLGGTFTVAPSSNRMNARLLWADRNSILGSMVLAHDDLMIGSDKYGIQSPNDKSVMLKCALLESGWMPTIPCVMFIHHEDSMELDLQLPSHDVTDTLKIPASVHPSRPCYTIFSMERKIYCLRPDILMGLNMLRQNETIPPPKSSITHYPVMLMVKVMKTKTPSYDIIGNTVKQLIALYDDTIYVQKD